MKPRGPKARRERRGKFLVMTALLMPAMAGFTALAVDTAVMATARSQLQTAADSAALAAARELARRRADTTPALMPSDVRAAHDRGLEFAGRNRILGTQGVLLPNVGNANAGAEDFVAGYLSRPFDPGQALRTDTAARPFFNTALIRASRTASRGGEVPGFFSRAFGRTSSTLSVRSAAAAVNVSGFRRIDGTARANVFPIVLDRDTYLRMIRGETTDQFTYNPATNQVTPGPDGIRESKLFPVSNGFPGNWGTVRIGVSNNSTAILGDQIRHGVTPAQMATYPGGILQPDPATGLIMLDGNPGISAGLKDDIQWRINSGISGMLPIFDPALSGGNGTNASYAIVAFAPVRLLRASFKGSNKFLIVQPAGMPVDATAVWGGIRDGPVDPSHMRLVLIR